MTTSTTTTPTGARRRVRALQALGWTLPDIADHAGLSDASSLLRLLASPHADLDRILVAYDQLCMTVPTPSPAVEATRRYATARGWLPPLAWDDIDTDPDTGSTDPLEHDDSPDETAVLRRLNGDKTVRLTTTEALEVLRRWKANGGTLAELERRTGINPYRTLRSAS